jgi:HAE1 family hydrophobic/amphiphilic exporter-1
LICRNSLERAINGVPGMKYIASDGNDGKFQQVIFNLGTDPNQASINMNRVASVVNKLPPLVVREGVKLPEKNRHLMYINLYSKDPNDGSKIFIQLY